MLHYWPRCQHRCSNAIHQVSSLTFLQNKNKLRDGPAFFLWRGGEVGKFWKQNSCNPRSKKKIEIVQHTVGNNNSYKESAQVEKNILHRCTFTEKNILLVYQNIIFQIHHSSSPIPSKVKLSAPKCLACEQKLKLFSIIIKFVALYTWFDKQYRRMIYRAK